MSRLTAALLAGLLTVTFAWPTAAQVADPDLVTFTGQVRHRTELDARFPQEDTHDLHLLRTRLGVGVAPTSDVGLFIQLQDARLFGSEDGTLDGDADQIDLHQAYFTINDLFDTPLRLTVGRQELAYGNERLVGAVGWHNVGRSFDAAVAEWASDDVAVDAFVARLDDYQEEDGDDASRNLFGLYSTWLLDDDHALDAFVLVDNNTGGARTVVSREMHLMRYTPGLYFRGASAPFDYELEAIYQGGEFADTDISAYLLSGSAGVTVGEERPVRFAATYTRLSGDELGEEPNSTFNTLFATNHKFYGYMDYFPYYRGTRGLQDAFVTIGTQLSERVTLGMDVHHFATSVPVQFDEDEHHTLGQELDLTLGFRYNDAFTITAGASAFRPGTLMENLLGSDDLTSWAYLMTSVTF